MSRLTPGSVLLATALLACAPLSPPAPPAAEASAVGEEAPPKPAPEFRIVGYCQPQTAASVELRELTNVFYAFATPGSDGSVALPGEPAVLHELVRRAHEANVAVSLSVGGWMDGDDAPFHALASSSLSRARFAKELREAVDTFGLDGIDIDWEFPEAEAREDFTALFAAVREALDEHTLLTAAVGAHESSAAGVTSDVLPYVTFLGIMAYDAEGESHAPFELARDALTLWRNKGFAPDKLVLGLPLYSRPHFLPFWEIVERDTSNADRDELRGETYNGRPTIIAKTQLALSQAGGVMVWELGQDARNEYSLLRTIASTVKERTASR